LRKKGSLNVVKLRKMQALVGVLLFCAINLRIVTCVYFLSLDKAHQALLGLSPVSPIVLLLLDSVFISFQTVCVRRDRSISLKRANLKASGAYLSLVLFEVGTVTVLGLLSCWQLLRSFRQLKDSSYRDSFLIELSDPGDLSSGAMVMPRYSSHLTFVFEMPFVARLIFIFAYASIDTIFNTRHYSGFDVLAIVAFVLCYQLVVFAVLAFDHDISQFVRRQYETQSCFGFPMLHFLYRSAELGSTLAGICILLVFSGRMPLAFAFAAVVYFCGGLVTLSVVSKGLSKRAGFMSIPFVVVNLALYADQYGLSRPARRLTCVLEGIRLCAALSFFAICVFKDFRLKQVFITTTCMTFFVALCLVLRATGLVGPGKVESSEDGVADDSSNDNPSSSKDQGDKSVFGRARDDQYVVQSDCTLASFLFAKGMGEQFASLVEIVVERDEVRLSRLRALDKLGQGGFGSVYQVQDTHTGCVYALKLQKKADSATCAVDEAKALHESTHLCIVSLINIFHTSQFYGILLELCDGDLNRRILERSAPGSHILGLPVPEVKHFAACMMLALDFLHARRIVFRDLKPENVLTAAPPGGGPHIAKLADFGLARSVDIQCPDQAQRPGHAGTRAFMPPEAFDSTRLECSIDKLMHVFAMGDWYAMGCCLVLMLLGERGGSIVYAQREVLLPLPVESMQATLQEAVDNGVEDSGALLLVQAMTRENFMERATGADMRSNSFFGPGILAVERLACDYAPAECYARRRRGFSWLCATRCNSENRGSPDFGMCCEKYGRPSHDSEQSA